MSSDLDYYSATLEEADRFNQNLFLEDIRHCTRCPLGWQRSSVGGFTCPGFFINLPLGILFVGMSPGREEDQVGRPFVGRAGKKLMELADAVGLLDGWAECADCGIIKPNGRPTEAESAPGASSVSSLPETFRCPVTGQSHKWINHQPSLGFSNVVRCHTPDNRPPTGQEISACSKWMEIELDMTEPKVVVLLGNTAIGLAFEGRIGEVAGSARAVGSTVYIASYHPAAALHKKSPAIIESILSSLRLAKEILDN